MACTLEDFKVGDEVLVVGLDEDLIDYKGRAFTITSIVSEPVCPIMLEVGGVKDFLAVEPHEIEPFLVSMEND